MDRFKFSPPRVLLVCLSKEFGGADVRVIQTARHLHDTRHSYAVLALKGGPLARRLADQGLNVVPVARRRWNPLLALDIVRAARAIDATIVDAHNVQSQYWAALAAQAMPGRGLVATIHSDYGDRNSRFDQRRRRLGAIRACNRAGASFIAVSSAIANGLKGMGVAEARIRTSWNGVEPPNTRPEPASIRTEAGWSSDAKVIATIGRLDENKGHALLIDALARIRAEGWGDLHLFIAGRGPDEARLNRLVDVFGMADRVHFAGFRRDVKNILAAADAHVMPSLSEGLPYALLEASEVSTPTIMSEVGAAPNLFEHGTNILFTKPGNIPELVAALRTAFERPETLETLGAGARALVDRRLNVRRMMAETLDVYNYTGFAEPLQAGDPAE